MKWGFFIFFPQAGENHLNLPTFITKGTKTKDSAKNLLGSE